MVSEVAKMSFPYLMKLLAPLSVKSGTVWLRKVIALKSEEMK